MRISFQRQVLTGIFFSTILVIVVGVSSYNSIKLQQENANLVDHTREVIKSSASVKISLLTAESNVRGLALTNNESFQGVYKQAKDRIWDEYDGLRNLVSDNPMQVARLDTLSSVLNRKMDLMDRQFEILTSGKVNIDSIRPLILEGKNLSSKIDFYFNRIGNTEQALLVEREQRALHSATQAKMFIVIGTVLFMLVIFMLYYFIQRTYLAQVASEAETNKVNSELEKLSLEDQQKNWILNAAIEIGVAIRGEPTQEQLADRLIRKLSDVSGALVGVMYLVAKHGDYLELAVTYGVDNIDEVPKAVMPGEGMLGQIIADETNFKRLDVSPGYFKVKSGVGSESPGTVMVKSLLFEGKVMALIEIAFLTDPGQKVNKLLDTISENVAIAVMAARTRQITYELLEKTQLQAEELESQQEELRVTNDDLIRQSSLLQVSEEELRMQQDELKQINTELEEKAFLLEEQKSTIEEAMDQIQLKANALEQSGKFKSEFLANMSHELRTPLNSILILSRILEENKGLRLSEEEQKYASIIQNSGNDLLTLINDILDLAKVESGKLELHFENVSTELLLVEVRNTFLKVAESKGLTLKLEKDVSCPETLFVDQVRLLQVVRNLLSNAIKFTSAPGVVSLNISKHSDQLHFAVADTGIGIPISKQKTIFEAFQQADGSTSRKYGGTGLGLSICTEIANLFKGSVSLESQPGKGSVFTFSMPVGDQEALEDTEISAAPEKIEQHIRQVYNPAEKRGNRLLLIEDDPIFAEDMAFKARNSGFEVIIAETGQMGLDLVKTFAPTAIILDMHLPDISGDEVLRELKNDVRTKLIPVHTVSAGDDSGFSTLRDGAIGFMQKPVDKNTAEGIFNLLRLKGKDLDKQRILLIEDDASQSKYLGDFLEDNNILVLYAYSASQALDVLATDSVDGIILDIRLSDMSGLDLLDEIKNDPRLAELPVVVNTAEDLSQADLTRIMKYAHPVVIKTRKSNERLLDEVKLFLKKIQPNTPVLPGQPEVKPDKIVHPELMFTDKKLLIADDDMRNIFALSAVLSDAGFTISIATNGREAIEKLQESPDIEMVLMDVMMPEMDGIEATRLIRQNPKWSNLPIIAVTAKAMQGDRDQCLAAGANDYISKPVDIDKLLGLIKVWLHSS